MLLIGTKCDMWRDRQIRIEDGLRASQLFGCVKFLEISTKESIDEVGNNARMIKHCIENRIGRSRMSLRPR